MNDLIAEREDLIKQILSTGVGELNHTKRELRKLKTEELRGLRLEYTHNQRGVA